MNPLMNVLITGANGQVGRALQKLAPASVHFKALGHAQLDIADAKQVERLVTEFVPELIINAAAFTAVDKAESEQDAARGGNVEGPATLALVAKALPNCRMIHLSTDFVFDGLGSRPYKPDDATAPLGVYGATKLAGEQAVKKILGDRSVVIRTAWVYAAQGSNFLRTMLRLMKERGAVRVVADQIGTPTAADSLAEVIWQVAFKPELSGIFHWTDAGVASWYDFAVAIAEEATALGLLSDAITLTPIATHEYPTPARRPTFSVLDKSQTYAALSLQPVHWRVRLRQVLKELSGA